MTGDHFYTISTAERDIAVLEHGYENEGTACHVFGTSILGTAPLHRLFNSRTGDHFYTVSDAERDDAVKFNRYRKEGEACYVYSTAQSNSVPLHRLFKSANGDHFYTTSTQERDLAVQQGGYVSEGIACHVLSAEVGGAVPLLRLLKSREVVIAMPPRPRKPQLGFLSSYLQPTSSPKVAESFAVFFAFANIGQATSASFDIRLFFINRDTNASTSQIVRTPPYPPGQGDSVFWPFPGGLRSGSYAVLAELDVNDEVLEAIEGPIAHSFTNNFVI